jgi:hypothetical protein
MSFKCRRKYRLELKWDGVVYVNSTTARLLNARFEGPVLNDVQKVESPDSIDLDLTPQFTHMISSYYFLNLSWAEAEHTLDGKINLSDAVVISQGLDTIHKLSNDDFILINTEKHREEVHAFNLVYESQVVKKDNTPYIYEK